MTYLIQPGTRAIRYIATFTTPVSHHDPAQQSSANIVSFLRRKQLVHRADVTLPDIADVNRVAQAFPVPNVLADTMRTLSAPEFLAVAAIQQFINSYGSKDGLGLFSGVERYRRLQERAAFHAIRTSSMFAWWGNLTTEMQVGMPARGDHHQQFALLGMPTALARLVLSQMVENSTSIVMLARIWNEQMRENAPTTALSFDVVDFGAGDTLTLQIPAFSANSIRHEMVREPGALHLLNALGLRYDDLDAGAAAMLYNGGELNSSEPPNAFKMTRQIIEMYPLLGLLGGSTSGFMLGASNLEVSSWLICQENNRALSKFGLASHVSAFDLLDRDEMTRHTAKRIDGTPMPFGFETLVAGTQLAIEFRLRPYATDMEVGALAAAIGTYFHADSTLGGQSARGFGVADFEPLMDRQQHDDLQALRSGYEEYLRAEGQFLAAGLTDGTLGTGKRVF